MENGTELNEQRAYVRKQLGVTDNDIQQSLTVLRSWLDKQPHLPKQIDDRRLEKMYLNCKCSLERTKRSLDAYFSLKNKFPELLTNRDPLSAELQSCKDFIKLVSMPRLTPDGYRVMVTTDITPDASKYHPELFFKVLLMWGEVMLAEDWSLGEIVIIDLRNFDVGHVVRVGVNLVRTVEILCREAYCRRVKAVHIVNSPKIIDMVLSVARAAVSEKLKNRISTHLPGSDTLFHHLPRELVPDELGGCGGKLDDLQEATWGKICSYREWLLDQDHVKSDESKRPPNSRSPGDLYGLDGSFRKLDID